MMRGPIIIFFAQLTCYGLITVNNRATVLLDYGTAVTTDILYASFQFFIIRKVATSPDSVRLWIAYVLGSVSGTIVGMLSSAHITPG